MQTLHYFFRISPLFIDLCQGYCRILLYNSSKRRSCWTCFSISLRAFTYPLLFSVRSWNKFRMTFGGSCYFYTHFGRPNSILMSNLKTHGSLLICVPLFTFVKKQEKWILGWMRYYEKVGTSTDSIIYRWLKTRFKTHKKKISYLSFFIFSNKVINNIKH